MELKNKEEFIAEILKRLDNQFSIPQLTHIADAINTVVDEYNLVEGNHLFKVAEFHKAFDHIINHKPVLDLDIATLRYKLLAEEVEELREAIEKRDIVGIFDALLDIEYVQKGAILTFGFTHVHIDGFNAVHESNMSKLCTSIEEAEETKIYYENKYLESKENFDVYIVPKTINNQLFFIIARNDGKILKNINYKPVDLLPIINKANNTLF